MTKTNKTRSALFTSIISLLLCVSMLVGTTFAWFTDSVVSGNNVIAAGNLDIELYNGNHKVTESTNLFDGIKWEPGVVDYENFTIKNEGDLALVYDFAINWGDYNQMTEGGYNLTQILKVAMVDSHVTGDRASAIAAGEKAGWKALDSWSFSGEMTTKDETKDFALIIYWEPSDNDNNWNVQNGKTTSDGKPLYVNLGINLQATQKMHESDSFGPDYDSLANPWDGSTGEVPAEEDGVITITTAQELAAFAASVNSGATYKNKTVVLGADINLANKAWTPIGACNTPAYFQGTFDGQNHTIYNLNVDKSTDSYNLSSAGLFGWVDAAGATIKNVNLENATVKGSHWVGAVAGYFTGRIDNCSVVNSTIMGFNVNDEANGDKVGGIVGYLNEQSYINNNSVSNTEIAGNRDIGGIAGSVAKSTYEMKNNKVENVTISYATDKDYGSAGAIVSGRTGYTPNETNIATNVTFVKSVVVSTADELAAAVKSTNKDIVITLANDIAVPMSSLGSQTSGSGEYKLFGENTETVIVDLNTHKLTLTTSYMTAIGAKNANATVTIKNGSMNGTGNSSTTWNINDLIFANCNYVFENVVFDKEVAMENDGKSVTMKNVTINGTGDYYALWISSRGQKVEIDGLTVKTPGRGIKIDEEYVSAPAKVTLKLSNSEFNTVKKAAIMVKSAAGADIALNNVDIDNVVDATNAVWVDEDAEAYENLVTVTGGTKICESEVITSASALNAALKDGQTNLLLAAGTYDVAEGKSKTVTITGLSKKAVITIANEGELGMDYGFDGATVTFNGVTIDTTKNGGTYPGFARMAATFNNCTINGTFNLSSGEKTFNNCEFNVSGDAYNVWTWGVKKVTFDGCTFNCDGKSVLVYNQACDVIVTDCVFNDNGNDTVTGKSALETGVDGVGPVYNITITNSKFNGFAENDKCVGYENIVGNKNSMTKDYLNIVVDEVDVY